MRKLLISCWLILVLPLVVLGQSVDLKWVKQTAGPNNGIMPLTAVTNFDGVGNAYQAGSFQGTTTFDSGVSLSASGGWNMFFLKRNVNGELQWIKQITGTGNESERINCTAIHVDNSNNIIITGWVSGGTYNFTSGISMTGDNSNAFVAKYDSGGNLLWLKKITSFSLAQGHRVTTDGLGNIYTIGHFSQQATFVPGRGGITLTGTNTWETYIAKYDSNGNVSWAKKIGGYLIFGYDLAVDNSQNVYAVGSFNSDVDFGSGITLNSSNGGAFYAKYDNLGNALWAKKIEGAVQTYDMELDNSNNIYLAGNFTSSTATIGTTTLSNNGAADAFFAKFDSQGNPVWAKSVGGTHNDAISNLKLDGSGNIYIGGSFHTVVNFGKTTLVAPWLQMVISNGVTTTYLNPSSDGFFAKYDNNGTEQFAKQIGLNDNNPDGVHTLSLDNAGNLLVGGLFSGTSYFNSTSTLSSPNGYNLFMAKYWAAPEIKVTNNISQYGATLVGSSSTSGTCKIENIGFSSLNITSITSNSPEFIVNSSISSINSNGSATFTVTFAPTSAGNKTATITIRSNDSDEDPTYITVTGSAVTPEINVKQGTTSIPNNGTSSFSDTRMGTNQIIGFTIENTGTASLTNVLVSIEGPDASSFSVSTPASPSVGVNASTQFSIKFMPMKMGPNNARIKIANSDRDENPYYIEINGVGLQPIINVSQGATNITNWSTIAIQGTLSLQPSPYATFTIANTGNTDLAITSITGSSNTFEIVLPSITSIPANQQTTFQIRYLGYGAMSTLIRIVNSTGSDFYFYVSSEILYPEINVREGGTNISHNGSLNMGTVTYGSGTQTIQKTLIIENIGTAPLHFTPLPAVSVGASFYSVTQPGVSTLEPNTSTTIIVTFSVSPVMAMSSSLYSSILTIKNNDTNESNYSINLSSSVLTPEINVKNGNTNIQNNGNLNFGTIPYGESITKTITIENWGDGEMRLSGSPNLVYSSSSDFVVDESSLTNVIPTGTSKTFTVTFTASQYATNYTGYLEVLNNDYDESAFRINLAANVPAQTDARVLTVFPNPSPDGNFTVEFTSNNNETFNVFVYNNQMQVVYSASPTKPVGFYSFGVDISNQPTGLYTLQIVNAQGALTKQIQIIK